MEGSVKNHPGAVDRKNAVAFLDKGCVREASSVDSYGRRVLQPKFCKVIAFVSSASGKVADFVVVTDIKRADAINQNGI